MITNAERIEDLFERLRPMSAQDRAGALSGEPPELREEVESLLQAADAAPLFDALPPEFAAQALLSEHLLEPGEQLGPYRVEALAGQGGSGEVYRAFDPRLGRRVAIKLLTTALSGEEARLRFQREMQALAALRHPHACVAYDMGSQEDRDYLVMEYLEGTPLSEVIRERAVSLDEARGWAAQLAAVLAEAHRLGIVHLDVKPANVFITLHGVKLLDLGIAKVGCDDFCPAGTPRFMAPEQIRRETVDARADIFAFGALMYEMLSGRPAFPGSVVEAILASVLHDRPESIRTQRPEIPEQLEQLVRKCLEKNPEQRYANFDEVSRELKDLRSPSAGRLTRRWVAAGAAAAGVGLISVLSLSKFAKPKPFRLVVPAPDGGRCDQSWRDGALPGWKYACGVSHSGRWEPSAFPASNQWRPLHSGAWL